MCLMFQIHKGGLFILEEQTDIIMTGCKPQKILVTELCTDLPSVIAYSEVKDLFWLLMSQMKEMNARTESTQPNSCMSNSDDQHIHCATIKMESSDTSQLRKSSKEKISSRDISVLAGTSGLHSVFQAI